MNESTATRYQRLRRAAQVVNLSVGAVWLSVAALTPVGRWAADRAQAFGAWRVLVFTAGLALVWEAVALPAGLWAAARGERRLRRGSASLATLFRSQLAGAGVGFVVAVAGALAIWLCLSTLGGWWWMAAGALGAPALVAATALAGVTARSASGSRPLARPDLAARLSTLAEQACGRRVPVREWSDPSVHSSAVVTGLGASGAILLSRDIAADWSDDEVAVVVAHELSHHARHDLWRKAGLDAAVLLVALGLAHVVLLRLGPALRIEGATDLAALPLIGLVAWAAWWALRPIRLMQSRAHERAADRFAIGLTGKPEAFRSAVRRLAASHLAEERPSTLTRWFFHRHPTPAERLREAGQR